MFKASQNLNLINSKGKNILVKTGEEIPEEFISRLIRHNRNFISNLEYKNGIPVLTKEQEKKFNVSFGVKPEEKGFKGKIKGDKYTQEKLTIKLNELGEEKFKLWAEKEVGEENIDRRKSGKSIINQLLKIQEENRR